MWSRLSLPGQNWSLTDLLPESDQLNGETTSQTSTASSFTLLFCFPLSFSSWIPSLPLYLFQTWSSHSPSCTSPASPQIMLRYNQPLRSKPIVERWLVRWLPYPAWTPTLFHIICTTLCQKAKDDIVCCILEHFPTTPSFPFPFCWLRHQSASFYV